MNNVYLLDLWCQVPFYDAYLCQALRSEGIRCALGSISFHLEPDYFRRCGLKNDPGLCDVVARLKLTNPKVRRVLKLLEFCGNVTGLASRFILRKPNIIHVQYLPLIEQGIPVELGLLKLAKKRGIKLVYTVHNVLPHDSKLNLREMFSKVYGLMDALICHTRESKDRLIKEFGLEAQKIWVVPHGPLFYDCEHIGNQAAKRYLGLSTGECIVMYQGFVRPYKGLEFLLEAWKGAHASHSNARLVIAGTGEKTYLEVIRAKVEALDIQSSVRLDLRYITTEDLPIYYRACDIAVYPHREITQSGALMTGIAFRKPIIATDLPGFREALQDYDSAVLVEYGDVKGLSQALAMLTANPPSPANLDGSSAMQSYQASWTVIAQQTRACYEAVLGKGGVAQIGAGYETRAYADDEHSEDRATSESSTYSVGP